MKKLGIFYPHGHELHREPGHPEQPERVEVIRQAFEEIEWWQEFEQYEPIRIENDILPAIHEPDYLRKLERISRLGMHFDADTYTTPDSWKLALNSAGGAASLASAIWRREVQRGFALTRPPGHHATRDRAMGFCLLNNVALAAEYLLQSGGATRLAIIDLDLHHGNGTQDIFFSRKDVCYFSTHQYPHYPGTGWLDEIGYGEGENTNINIPLPPFSGDWAFSKIMSEIILPLLDRFQPEMILVSYGFDPHWSDPLGSLQLTSSGYGKLIGLLTKWVDHNCEGRICLFLEGGYNLEAAVACSLEVISVLIDEEAPQSSDFGNVSGRAEDSQSFNAIYKQIKQIWSLD
jgi:acetoin utilization deacetylase AcuC-like enzyme